MRRDFGFEELQRIKGARRWTQADFSLFGQFEYYLLHLRQRLSPGLCHQFHNYVRQAHLQLSRSGQPSPWNGDYEFCGDKGDLAPAVEVPDVAPVVRVDFAGQAKVFVVPPQDVTALLGGLQEYDEQVVASAAAVAKELEAVAFDGSPELVAEDAVPAASSTAAALQKKKLGRPRKVVEARPEVQE